MKQLPRGPRGWNYIIGYWVPGPDKEGNDTPAQNYFVRIEYRDTLEAAQRIYQVLCETDISHTAYGIILDPIY